MTDPATPPPAARDRLSRTAFVLGLVSALTGVLYFVAVPVGLAGLAVAVAALRRPEAVRRVALGGLLLSLIGLLVGLGVIAFLVLDDDPPGGRTTVLNGIESLSTDDEHPPQLDLGPAVSCASDAGALRAEGDVTNPTDETADYQLFALWERAGKPIAQATARVEGVAPGATAAWRIDAVGDEAPGTTSCRVVRIDRE